MSLFELHIHELRPHWRMAERVRDAVFLGLGAVMGEPTLPGMAMMVAGELVENVFRFSDWDASVLPSFHAFTAPSEPVPTNITFRVTNPIKSGNGDYERLRAILQATQDEASVLEAFAARRKALQGQSLRPSTDAAATHTTAQLGLLAIAAEGRTRFRAQLEGANILKLEAVVRV